MTDKAGTAIPDDPAALREAISKEMFSTYTVCCASWRFSPLMTSDYLV